MVIFPHFCLGVSARTLLMHRLVYTIVVCDNMLFSYSRRAFSPVTDINCLSDIAAHCRYTCSSLLLSKHHSTRSRAFATLQTECRTASCSCASAHTHSKHLDCDVHAVYSTQRQMHPATHAQFKPRSLPQQHRRAARTLQSDRASTVVWLKDHQCAST